ncbi:MAG TPA: pyruvate kinase [Clostridiales bacterium]|nr:pyruvate kinase [Clostridiales bacterium]
MRKTKIICTLGPASEKPHILKRLIELGTNVVRLNFSHGDYAEHKRRIELVKEYRAEFGLPVAILLDTKGPEIRLGKFKKSQIYLEEGQPFTLTIDECLGDERRVSITYKDIVKDVYKGSCILVDDGLVELIVDDVTERDVHCTVVNGGTLGDHKGVNIPGIPLNLPNLTDKDREDIRFGIKNGVDYIASSFVQRAEDIINIRDFLTQNGGEHIQIIAKIENQLGIDNIDEIIEAADGVMIARGDLGVEIPIENVPIVQKSIINKCILAGKPVITATQMLDSMIRNPRPTRAEVSDVANAIYDGCDAIMLSGETAVGKYPIETFTTMVNIARKVEESIDYDGSYLEDCVRNISTTTHAISHASCTIARELGAKAIVTPTKSGYTTRMVSRYRPKPPIIATTTSYDAYRRLALIWGVIPKLVPDVNSTDEMIEKAEEAALTTRVVNNGDMVVITAGVPVGQSGKTNLIKVHVVGQ